MAQPSPDAPTYPAAGPVPFKQASNFLVVDPSRSAARDTLAVMGPQLGYYYPEIVEQVHLTGPGVDAQGVGVPGAMMYMLIGRTHDYAWSLTSANNDVRDVFAEQLCNPDGSPPTQASDHYLFDGVCRPFQQFDAGLLNGVPLRYPVSVHGPVIGWATSNGRPVALTRQRSTFGRDGLNLGALKDLTEGKATTAQRFYDIANQFGFTFNWAYASRRTTAYFSSGLLPVRAPGLDRRLPTLGTGQYEWRGFLREQDHPHGEGGVNGLFLNWNNQSAPGFMHGDDDPYGSVHRVELFSRFPSRVRLADDVSIMNRAATEDVRAPVWPVVSRVLRSGPAPSPLAAKVVDVVDDWVRRDAPVLDADNSGQYDDAGPAIMNLLWGQIADAVVRPRLGDQTADLDAIRGLGSLSGESIVDKDLRTLLGDPVRGKFQLRYCGKGDLAACRASLWDAVTAWPSWGSSSRVPSRPRGARLPAAPPSRPGLIPDTFRITNRPTFQQVLELPSTARPPLSGSRPACWRRPRESPENVAMMQRGHEAGGGRPRGCAAGGRLRRGHRRDADGRVEPRDRAVRVARRCDGPGRRRHVQGVEQAGARPLVDQALRRHGGTGTGVRVRRRRTHEVDVPLRSRRRGTRLVESFEMLEDLPLKFRIADRAMGIKDRTADLERAMGETLARIKQAVEASPGV